MGLPSSDRWETGLPTGPAEAGLPIKVVHDDTLTL